MWANESWPQHAHNQTPNLHNPPPPLGSQASPQALLHSHNADGLCGPRDWCSCWPSLIQPQDDDHDDQVILLLLLLLLLLIIIISITVSSDAHICLPQFHLVCLSPTLLYYGTSITCRAAPWVLAISFLYQNPAPPSSGGGAVARAAVHLYAAGCLPPYLCGSPPLPPPPHPQLLSYPSPHLYAVCLPGSPGLPALLLIDEGGPDTPDVVRLLLLLRVQGHTVPQGVGRVVEAEFLQQAVTRTHLARCRHKAAAQAADAGHSCARTQAAQAAHLEVQPATPALPGACPVELLHAHVLAAAAQLSRSRSRGGERCCAQGGGPRGGSNHRPRWMTND